MDFSVGPYCYATLEHQVQKSELYVYIQCLKELILFVQQWAGGST